jgi:hypothetical protein
MTYTVSETRNNSRRRGTALIEFGLIVFPLILILFGVTVIGLQLGQSVRGSQITRDAASMYVRGIDFTLEANQDLLVRLAQGMGLAKTGGKGVLIFSKVTWVSQAQCTAAGLSPCNGDRHVVTQQIIVGNVSLRASALGSPNSAGAQGLVLDYMQNPTAIADSTVLAPLHLDAPEHAGDVAYVTEGYFDTPEIRIPGFERDPGVYTIALY